MNDPNWHPAIRTQHWLAVALLIVCVGAIWGADAFEKTDVLRGQMKQLHFLAGVAVGLAVLLRLTTRFYVRAPARATVPGLAWASRLTHIALYALLVVLPVLGYAAASGKGVPLSLLGVFELAPLPVDKATAHALKALHEALAYGLLGLVGLHVGAAIYHAAVLRDRVLQAMLGRAGERT